MSCTMTQTMNQPINQSVSQSTDCSDYHSMEDGTREGSSQQSSVITSTNQEHQSTDSQSTTDNQSINDLSSLSSFHLRNNYGRLFLRFIHQPRIQQLMTRMAIGMNIMILVSSIITLTLIAYLDMMFSIYLSTICVRSLIMLILHVHCLYVPDMVINRHSIQHPATMMHKVRRAIHISIRIESMIIMLVAFTCLFTQFSDDVTLRSMALIWIGIDIMIVLGELTLYGMIIQVISWRVVSLIAPYVPISSQSIVLFQCEEQQVQQQAAKRAGLDKPQLTLLKQSQHRYHPDTTSINSECAICLLDFEMNEKINTLKCQHSFHSQCITLWLTRRGTCPLCVTRAEPMITSNTRITTSKSRSGSSCSSSSLSSDIHNDVELTSSRSMTTSSSSSSLSEMMNDSELTITIEQ